MRLVGIIDLIGLIAALAGLAFLLRGRQRGIRRDAKWMLAFLILMAALHNFGNVLAWWVGAVRADLVEDHFEVIWPVLWGFVLYALLQDVAHRELRESEERNRMLLASLPQHIFFKNRDSVFLLVNESFARDLGATPEEVVGKTDYDFFPNEVAERYCDDDRRVMETRRLETVVEREAARGEQRVVEIVRAPVVDDDGDVVGLLGVLTDITGRKRAEEELARERYLLKALMDTIPDHIYFKDQDSRFIRVSKALADWFDLSDPEQAGGKTDFDFFTQEHARQAYRDEQQIIRTGQPLVGIEEKETWPGARETWVSTTKVPLRDEDGRIVGTFGISRNITESRAAQQALSESEERFRMLVSTSFDGINICEYDPDTENRRLIFCNDRYVEMSGYAREQLENADNLDDLTVAYWPPEEQERQLKLRDEGLPFSGVCSWERPDGKENFYDWSAILLKVGGKYHLMGFDRDITERRRTEEALRASEERFRMLVSTAFDGINISEQDPATDKRRLVFCNDRYVEMSGYTREELEIADDLTPLAQAHMTEQELEDHEERLQKRIPARGTASWLRPDGKENTYEFAAVAVKVGDKRHIIGFDRDITERIEAEKQLERYAEGLERLATELERSNRDLEDFTYTVSHDLQEPLRKIHTFGQFLIEDCGEHVPEEGREYLGRIQDAAVRMKDLIQHLLSLARVGTRGGKLVPTEPQEVLSKVLDTLSESIKECGAEVVVQDTLPVVEGDAVQLGQVFQNLIGNALKFRSPERSPQVRINADVKDGLATFSVSDNGIGIEERFLKKIFGVFQRLHPRDRYKGAGVGLALCEKVIHRHGGEIWAESEPGEGTTIGFTLPLATTTVGAEK